MVFHNCAYGYTRTADHRLSADINVQKWEVGCHDVNGVAETVKYVPKPTNGRTKSSTCYIGVTTQR